MAAKLTDRGKIARHIVKASGVGYRWGLKLADDPNMMGEPVRRCLAFKDWCERSGFDFDKIVQPANQATPQSTS